MCIRDSLKSSPSEDLKKRIEYAMNWVRDFEETAEVKIELSEKEKRAILSLIDRLQLIGDPEVIQSSIFEIARANGIKPRRFFEILYIILLGTRFGPRLGPYLVDMGRANAIKILKRSIDFT